MNYINKLQDENAELRQNAADALVQINELMAYLTSDKFFGYNEDGSRRDLVNPKDVMMRLQPVKSLLLP